ncbi:MAG: hypothetical protein K6E27_05045 [Eubacterium sp.]|nr:hypothetical protein [Eubacterium sp.]
MRKTKLTKQITSLILASTLCLGVTACGNGNETVVDDYGVQDQTTESSDATPSAASSDTNTVSGPAAGSLQEMLGEEVSFDKEFTVDGVTVKGNASFAIPDQQGLNIYNMESTDDGKKDEDAIVKALLGDSAEKLESIKYTNQYDYITLLYKYKNIIHTNDYFKASINGSETMDIQLFDRTVIDATFDEEYKWTDGDKMYIHMYEGDYKNTRFVLLLAYDYTTNMRYIFFEPKSIKDYFPDYDFKTVLVAGDKTASGADVELENFCSDDKETLKEDAQSLLDNELNFKGQFNVTENAYLYKMLHSDPVVEAATTDSFVFSPSYYESASSVLMFSNTDFQSTVHEGIKGVPINYFNIAEQRDIKKEYESETGKEKDFYEFLFSDTSNKYVDETTFTVDGYAFYIDGLKTDDEEDDTAITFNDTNTGIIKYTSMGLYSIDLRLSDKVVDVRENVSLMPFDQIAENLPAQLEGQLDLDKLGKPSTLNISDIQLSYYSNLTKEETIKMASASDSENYNKSYQSVPTWMIELASTTEGNLFAYATINAIDGTLINIEYYDVSEVD